MSELRFDSEQIDLSQEETRRLAEALRSFHAGSPGPLAHLQASLDQAVVGIRLDRFEQHELYEALYAIVAAGEELPEPLARLRSRLFSLLAAGEPPAAEVTEASFEHDVIEQSRRLPVAVYFWAAWCGPSCRVLAPLLERELAAQEGRVALARVDIDAAPELARRLDIHTIPAIRAYRNGTLVGGLDGPQRPKAIRDFIVTLATDNA